MEAVGYQNSFRAQMLGDDQEERPEGQGSGGVVGRWGKSVNFYE